jgi:hypothetical protein
MRNYNLTPEENAILDHLINAGQITEGDLPRMRVLGNAIQGPMIGMDSMGPMRNPKTDRLFPEIPEALHAFSDTLNKYSLTFVLATNGPDIEGMDVLNQLNWKFPIKAFAVTQGGGKRINYDNGNLVTWTMANQSELAHLGTLEQRVKTNPVMKALLEDKQDDAEGAPIRTPYDTNIVLTLPTKYGTLLKRLGANGIQLEKEVPNINEGNYVSVLLNYASAQFAQAIQELKLNGKIAAPLIKQQNRRIYVMPLHLVEDFYEKNVLAKASGVDLASRRSPFPVEGYQEVTRYNSIYVADKAVDVTGEGQVVVGASEKSMIYGLNFFEGELPRGLKIVKRYDHNPKNTVLVAEVANRLTINVTMDSALPRVHFVEGVKILDIGSGAKSLEAITHLYDRLHT